MTHPLIQVVNEDDEPVGEAEFKEVYSKGLLHRIVQIVVEDSGGRILLQKRGPDVATNQNAWDFSVGGHVDTGEDYIKAAKREAQEELGLSDINLQEIDKLRLDTETSGYQLHRFVKIYKVVIPPDTKLEPATDEVTEVKWFSVDEARALINDTEHMVTNELVRAIDKYYPQ